MTEDKLALWRWDAGDDRAKLTLGHKKFAEKARERIGKGVVIPE